MDVFFQSANKIELHPEAGFGGFLWIFCWSQTAVGAGNVILLPKK
jgi:hypothetical protein